MGRRAPPPLPTAATTASQQPLSTSRRRCHEVRRGVRVEEVGEAVVNAATTTAATSTAATAATGAVVEALQPARPTVRSGVGQCSVLQVPHKAFHSGRGREGKFICVLETIMEKEAEKDEEDADEVRLTETGEKGGCRARYLSVVLRAGVYRAAECVAETSVRFLKLLFNGEQKPWCTSL